MTSLDPDAPARRVIVRYTVKPDQVERNEALIRAVYDELERVRPDGLQYATFRLGDGAEFVHLASSRSADGRSPLTEIAAFRAFQEGIHDRCEVAPVSTELHEIGSYRVFDDAD
jgi:hypothetical protein